MHAQFSQHSSVIMCADGGTHLARLGIEQTGQLEKLLPVRGKGGQQAATPETPKFLDRAINTTGSTVMCSA